MTIWSNSQGVAFSLPSLSEREVGEAVPEGWVLLETNSGVTRAMRITRAATESRADYAASGKATGLTLVEPKGTAPVIWNDEAAGIPTTDFSPFTFRNTVVKLASQPLELGGLPITEDVTESETELMLDGLYLDLEPAAPSRSPASAPTRRLRGGRDALLADVTHSRGYTKLSFSKASIFP